MKYTVISFYTQGTGYEREIINLTQSLSKFSIPFDIRPVQSLGSWHANINYKARFIRDMIDVRGREGDQAIVWMDADSVVLRKPDIFDWIDTDAAFYLRTNGPSVERLRKKRGWWGELISAVMYFRTNDSARRLLDMWIQEIPRYTGPLDQEYLQAVIPAWRAQGGTVTMLPQTYSRIFDAPEDYRVIEQRQASRRFRAEVDR